MNLPKPFADETFTSWVFRCANSKGVDCHRLGDLTVQSVYCQKTKREVFEDPDFDFDSPYIRSILEKFSIDKAIAAKLFGSKSSMLLSWGQRKYFCPLCFQEDIAGGYLPYWRKDWCCMLVTSCSCHGVRLMECSTPPRIGRAWHAFVEYSNCRCFDKFLPLSSKWHCVNAESIRRKLAEKTRRWYLRRLGARVDGVVVYEGYRKCFEVFFHLFLQLQTRTTHLGLASAVYEKRLKPSEKTFDGYPHAYELGATESDSTQRMVALIWCGMLFSIYSNLEVFLLRKFHSECHERFTLPWDRIARCYFGGLAISDYYYLRCQLSGVPEQSLESVREFLVEFELQYRARKYCSMYGWDSSNACQRWHLDPLNDVSNN